MEIISSPTSLCLAGSKHQDNILALNAHRSERRRFLVLAIRSLRKGSREGFTRKPNRDKKSTHLSITQVSINSCTGFICFYGLPYHICAPDIPNKICYLYHPKPNKSEQKDERSAQRLLQRNGDPKVSN